MIVPRQTNLSAMVLLPGFPGGKHGVAPVFDLVHCHAGRIFPPTPVVAKRFGDPAVFLDGLCRHGLGAFTRAPLCDLRVNDGFKCNLRIANGLGAVLRDTHEQWVMDAFFL